MNRYENNTSKVSSANLSDEQLWNEMRWQLSARTKVDEDGNYLPFPNITVVCHLRPHPALEALPEALNRVAGRYMHPLPASSYHATLICGPIRRKTPQFHWDNVLYDTNWAELAGFLQTNHYFPKNLTANAVVCKHRGGATVYIGPPSEEHQFPVGRYSYFGDDETAAVRQRLRTLDARLEPRDRPWHVTLAYPRKSGGPMPEAIKQQVVTVVTKYFEAASSNHGGALAFDAATLCLSPDMTRFVPWNGRPFGDRIVQNSLLSSSEGEPMDINTTQGENSQTKGGGRRKKWQQENTFKKLEVSK